MIVEHYTVDLSTMPSYRRRMREKRRAQRHRRITAACLAIIAGMMICASCVLISDSFRGHPAYAMEPNMAKLPEPTIEPFPNDLLIVVNDEPAPVVDTTTLPQAEASVPAENVVPETPAIVDAGPETAIETTAEEIQEYAEETAEPALYCGMDDAQIYELALMCVAEAEGEPEYGQRLVIDAALNRMDDGAWPDEIIAVIHQAHQFSSFENGRIYNCTVTDYFIGLVKEELAARTDYTVFYFTAGGYGAYGTPLFQVGNHYFCGK